MTATLKKLLTTATASYCAAAAACTTFTVLPEASETGNMMLHKCRDRKIVGRLDANIRGGENGVRWMQIGFNGTATFAMNSRGVAMTSNTGNKLEGWIVPAKKRKAKPWSFDRIMEASRKAEDGIPLIKMRQRNPGGIYLIADAKRAFLVEIGAGYGEHMEIPGGLLVVANEMHLPGIENRSAATAERVVSQRAREANTRAALRKTRNKHGKYTRRGMFATSRIICGDTAKTRTVFCKYSLTAVCFEIDGEFPELLSTAYIALGPQRHTVYLSCPMALKQFPKQFRDGSWAKRALELRQKLGEENPMLPRIVALEDKMLEEYDRTRAEARELLREGRHAEAEKLLTDLFARHFAAADKLLNASEKTNADAYSYSGSCF